MAQHTVTVPLHVNVVPGDEAAGRIPDPVVRTEVAFLRAQQAKSRASTHLSSGDTAAALREIGDAQATVDAARVSAPAKLAADLHEVADALRYLAYEAEHGIASRAVKFSSSDACYKSSKRGTARHRRRGLRRAPRANERYG